MTLTIEIPESTLAAIWRDTWEDRQCGSMERRIEVILGEKHFEFMANFPNTDGAELLAAFRKSKAYTTES